MNVDDNPEHFSLRWNNFHTNITNGFNTLLEEEDLVDVTIAVEGKFVQAHKVVLSICSPYFKQLFKVNPCKHPIVILKDVGYREIMGLLQFMYQGEVSIAQENLPDFLRAAELLHIKGLTGSDSEESKTSKRNTERIEPFKTGCKTSFPIMRLKKLETPPGKSFDENKSDLDQAQQSTPFTQREVEPFVPKDEAVDIMDQETWQNDVGFNKPLLERPFPGTHQGGFQMTSRGRLQLVQNGYVYHCNRQTEDKIFWKCAEYNRTRCKSRCISVGGSVTVTHPNHNHVVRSNLTTGHQINATPPLSNSPKLPSEIKLNLPPP